jgi:hypothetical protein
MKIRNKREETETDRTMSVVILPCPMCQMPFECKRKDIRCGLFVHGWWKPKPHARKAVSREPKPVNPEEELDRAIKRNRIIGCGTRFTVTTTE